MKKNDNISVPALAGAFCFGALTAVTVTMGVVHGTAPVKEQTYKESCRTSLEDIGLPVLLSAPPASPAGSVTGFLSSKSGFEGTGNDAANSYLALYMDSPDISDTDVLDASDDTAAPDTDEESAEAIKEPVTESHTSVYIPQATIITTVSYDENEEESVSVITKFNNGRVLDYDVDVYIDEVDEIEFFYHLVEAESGNQSSLGRRLVADCVLNQRDSGKYPPDIKSVILSPGNYSVVSGGSIFTVTPSESTKQCVEQEMESRIDYAVMYFRTNHYHTFGVPYEVVGDVWFSKACEDNASQWTEE